MRLLPFAAAICRSFDAYCKRQMSDLAFAAALVTNPAFRYGRT